MYAQALSGFLRWAAGRYERIQERWPGQLAELREAASSSDQHRRTPQIVANLQLGMEYFLRFARTCGALSEKSADKLSDQCWAALGSAAKAQYLHQKSEDPVDRFLQLMQSLLASGRAYLQDLRSENQRSQKGDHIGWRDGGVAMLNPEAAFGAAQKLAQDQGEYIVIGQKALWQRMADRRLLVGSDPDRNLKKEPIMGQRKRVIKIPIRLLRLDAEDRDDRDDRS